MEDISKKITEELVISKEKNALLQKKIKNIIDLQKAIKSNLAGNLSDLMEIIFGGAIILDASDIHIEPEEKTAKIRLRIDGLLQDIINLDLALYESLLSRIKLLSGVKLNVSDRPQDGRFSILLGEISIEIRVSTLPAEHGETIVMRILNPKSLIGLEDLGLRTDLFYLFEKEIKKPNGMIIITGPTGSGKTTTLYAFLNKIQNPEIKIITIEDPIEYHLKGISQTQVNPSKGYDFASGLQAIVRQDPDVILVGEIRDDKTCQIALQAALTGHLVFTTLHTNDAAGTIARLLSLKADLSNIGPAVNLVVAQRLVRKICSRCAGSKPVDTQTLAQFKKELRNLPKNLKIPVLKPELKIPQAKGCSFCNQTGYHGRVGLFEAFLIDNEMEKFILKNPPLGVLREEAIKRGMITMHQDGLIKILEAKTTLEEVERATGSE